MVVMCSDLIIEVVLEDVFDEECVVVFVKVFVW